MNVTISVPDDIAAKLEKRASGMGQTIPDYATRIITENVTRPTLDEILAPVREDFARSGMTEEDLLNLGRTALDAVRQEKKAKSA